jgi:outer membrane protein
MKVFIAFIAGLLMLTAGYAAAQSLKIGYVNGSRLENESALTLQAIEEVKKEFAPREQQLNDMQKQGLNLQAQLENEGAKMQPAEKQAREKTLTGMMQQFEQMRRSYAEDLEIRKREMRARVVEQADAVIKVIAETGKFDLIVQQAVYGSPQIDITDQVLKEMAKRAGSAASPRK